MRTFLQRRPIGAKWLPVLYTGLAGIPGGLLFQFLHFPIPWMLGPLTATLVYQAASGSRARWPVEFRNIALLFIGYSIGRTVSVETTRQLLDHLPAMAGVTVLTILFCMAMGYVTHRRTGISLSTSVLGSMPGGLAQMVVLAEEIRGADMAVVIFMQVTRVLAVIFIVPFVATYGMVHPPVQEASAPAAAAFGFVDVLPAILLPLLGAWLAVLMKFPLPFMLGPILATAAAMLVGYEAPVIPRGVMNAAQLLFGIYTGRSIALESLRKLGKVLPYALGGAVILVAFSYMIALTLTWITPATLLTTFLGTAPGGLTELCIVALTLGADAAFVVAFQLFRVFAILLATPPLLRRKFNRREEAP